ncbi:MAG TPA: hypothetical protein VKY19_28100 [Ktedonosporobacter sp.]|nr:hypothetical protein [Ktedonosporobacter sp.]
MKKEYTPTPNSIVRHSEQCYNGVVLMASLPPGRANDATDEAEEGISPTISVGQFLLRPRTIQRHLLLASMSY